MELEIHRMTKDDTTPLHMISEALLAHLKLCARRLDELQQARAAQRQREAED